MQPLNELQEVFLIVIVKSLVIVVAFWSNSASHLNVRLESILVEVLCGTLTVCIIYKPADVTLILILSNPQSI